MSSRHAEAESAARPAEPQTGPPAANRRGRRFLVARVASLAVASLAVILFAVAVPASYGQMASLSGLPEGIDPVALRSNLAEAGVSVAFYAAFRLVMEIVFATVCLALAAAIFWRRPNEPVALFVSLLLVLLGTTFWSTLQTFAATHPVWAPVVDTLDSLGIVSLFLFFYLFPDGRFVPRWTRWVAAAALAHVAAMVLFPGSPLNPDNVPVPLFLLFLLGLLLTGVYAQVHRYRRVSSPVQRQQAKWVVFGFAAALTGFLGVILLGEVLFSSAEPGTVSEMAGSAVITAFMSLIPLSIGIAILRHRLFDIDLVINRTLVYGVLTLCVVAIYVLVVGYLGALFQTDANLPISLVAAGLVAVLFAPLRERLQRGVNRLMYGERDDPYAALSRFGRRLEATLAPDAVLPAIVGTVKETLRLPYAAITLAGHGSPTAQAGEPVVAPLRLPLSYQNEPVGELLLGPRTGEEGFSPGDKRLLDDLARQAGVAAHAVGLTSDLQRARERLVTAREEERRRLRRDLHDGLGPQLSSQALTIDAVRALMRDDPDAAEALLLDLKAQAQDAVTDIRRLVYDLRPPALDDLGLLGALRESAAQYGHSELAISVDAPQTLPTPPAAVEVALYRIAQEAMTNVVRHARARTCAVSLAVDEEAGILRLEVRDDGRGLPEARSPGVGLSSMRERAAELGGSLTAEPLPEGGTVVRAGLPLAVER